MASDFTSGSVNAAGVDDRGTWNSQYASSVDIQPVTDGRIWVKDNLGTEITTINSPYGRGLVHRRRDQFSTAYLEAEAIIEAYRRAIVFPLGDAIAHAKRCGVDVQGVGCLYGWSHLVQAHRNFQDALVLAGEHYSRIDSECLVLAASQLLQVLNDTIDSLNRHSGKTGRRYELVKVPSRWGYIRMIYLRSTPVC